MTIKSTVTIIEAVDNDSTPAAMPPFKETLMAHVIFSRNNDNGILTTDRIRQLAPSVFSTTKAEHLTERYVPLHTSDQRTAND